MKKITSLIVMFLIVTSMVGINIARADTKNSGIILMPAPGTGTNGPSGVTLPNSGNTQNPANVAGVVPPRPVQIGGHEEDSMSIKDIVGYRYDNAITLLNDAYNRLSNVITRLSNAGFNMTDANAKLAIARTKIDLAQTAVNNLEKYVAGIPTAGITPNTNGVHPTLPSANSSQLKKLAKLAKDAIKVAHQANMDVLHAITASFGLGNGEDNGNATGGNQNGQDTSSVGGAGGNTGGHNILGFIGSGVGGNTDGHDILGGNPNQNGGGNYNPDTTIACPPGAAPSLKVLSPNGEEVFTAGQQIMVRWRACNIPANTLLQIDARYKNPGGMGGAEHVFTKQALSNNGSALITLPTNDINSWDSGNSVYYGNNFTIAIWPASGGPNIPNDMSDNSFTINSNALQAVKPVMQ